MINVELPLNRIFPLFMFFILETFLWGATLGILHQRFHSSFHFLQLINKPEFGLTMVISSLITAYNLWRPIKKFNYWIVLLFLLFCLFHRSFVTIGYLSNSPIDGAWGRNFAEVLAILWITTKVKFIQSQQ